MEESAKRRRIELIAEVRRHRETLEVLQFAKRAPSLAQVAARVREIEEKLHLLDEELHNLNVQLIREGLSANAP